MNIDQQFQAIIKDVMENGYDIETRNSLTKRLEYSFLTFTSTPLICSRRTAWKSALREMEWFLSGSNNVEDLHPSVRKWWEPWANDNSLIPNNYGCQFRSFYGKMEVMDQIEYLIEGIKNHPYSRRNVITTWNTTDMTAKETPITNCHNTICQCFVRPDNSLHMTMYQRSCDMLLGVPHNFIAQWAMLTWLAHRTGKTVGSFTWVGGDVHVYKEHQEFAKKLINTNLSELKAPNLLYNPTSKEFKAEDFSLDAKYEPLFKESLPMVV